MPDPRILKEIMRYFINMFVNCKSYSIEEGNILIEKTQKPYLKYLCEFISIGLTYVNCKNGMTEQDTQLNDYKILNAQSENEDMIKMSLFALMIISENEASHADILQHDKLMANWGLMKNINYL